MKRIFNKSVFIFPPVVPCYTHDVIGLVRDGSDHKDILSNKTGS